MRGEPQQPSPLGARLEDEPEVAVLEIPNAAVNQPRRPARRAASEVRLLDETDAEAAQRRLQRDSAARNPAADYDHVEELPRGTRPGHLVSLRYPFD